MISIQKNNIINLITISLSGNVRLTVLDKICHLMYNTHNTPIFTTVMEPKPAAAKQNNVPPCTWPRTPTVNVILCLLSLQAAVCLDHASNYPRPVRIIVRPIQSVMLQLFRSQRSLRIFFYCTLLVHLLEALYALALIRRACPARFGGGAASLLWALQTTLVGFPSLLLLKRMLADTIHKEEQSRAD